MIRHVIVIGGGVAGLAAATRLAESGARVTVLEAAPIAGGRARSWTDAVTGDVVDNGQHLVMGCYRETLAFLERIGARDQVEFQDRLQVGFADAKGGGGVIDCPPLPGPLSLIWGLAFYRGLGIADRLGVVRLLRDAARLRREDRPEGDNDEERTDGFGPESVLRDDRGPGGALRDGRGPGGASRDDSGPGGALRDGHGPRGAPRDDSGPGSALRDGTGPGNARREGRGPGGDRPRTADPTNEAVPHEDESAAAYLARLGQTPRARRALWDPFILAALNDRPEAVSALTFRRVLRIGLLGPPEEARLGWAKVGLGDLYAPAAARYLAARGGVLRTSAPVVSVSTLLSPDDRDAPRGAAMAAASPDARDASRERSRRSTSQDGPPDTMAGKRHEQRGAEEVRTGETIGLGHRGREASRDSSSVVERVGCQTAGGVEVVLRTGERLRADAAVIAVTPGALARLLPPALAASPRIRAAAALATSPILGVNLWFDRPIVATRFVGLLGTTMQWLFNKGAMLAASGSRARAGSYVALVVSGARAEIDRGQDDLIAAALADLRAVLPEARRARLLHALVVKEREATVSPAPGWDALRPGPRTSDPALYLAGDWTATGLPATIESAALSGHRAAAAVLSGP